MEEREIKSSDDAVVDGATFITSANIKDATPLQIERAKVKALSNQVSRALDHKRQMQHLLEQTQADLELQIKQTLRLQRQQAQRCKEDAKEKQVPASSGETRELKKELASTQKELADEISKSQKKEARIKRLQNQCNSCTEQLDALKKKQSEQEGGEDNERSTKRLIANLEHQRSELVMVVKKQMKLIEILQQKQAHIEAATLLNITEKGFIKEFGRGCRNIEK